MNGLELVFHMVLAASVQAAAIAVLVVLLQLTLGRRFGVRWQYTLWLVVLARLLMLWTPGSSLSVWNLPERLLRAEAPLPVAAAMLEPVSEPLAAVTFDVPVVAAAPVELPAIAPVPVKPEPTSAADVARWGAGHAGVLWMGGALAVFLVIVARAIVFSRRMRTARPVEGERIERILADCRARIGVRKTPRVCETPVVPVPVLFGLVRQRIILPEGLAGRLSDRELAFVFLHELAHVRRRDLAMNWLMALAQCAHWFNPFIWVALARMRADREMAADALVVESARPGEALDYGRTLVSLLEGLARRRPAFVALGILERRSRLKRRIAMIADYKPGTVRTTLLGLVALLALAVVTLTAAENKPEAEPDGIPAQPTAAAAEDVGVTAVAVEPTTDVPKKRPMSETEREAAVERRYEAMEDAFTRAMERRMQTAEGRSRRAPAAQDPHDTAMEKLNQRLATFDFSGQPLSAVIDHLRTRAELNIVLDVSIPGDRLVLLQLSNATVKSILNLVTVNVGAKWAVAGGLVYIGTDADIAELRVAVETDENAFRVAAGKEPQVLETWLRLHRVVDSLELAGQPATAAIELVRAEGPTNIVVDGAVGDALGRYVTVKMERAPLWAVLDQITRALGLRWAVVDNYVFVAASDAISKLGDDSKTLAPPLGRSSYRPVVVEPAESYAVRRRLEKRLATFDFVNQTLEAALQFLRFAAEVNIVSSPTVPREHPVTLGMADTSIATLLTELTRGAGLEWAIVENYVYIGTPDEIAALRERVKAGAMVVGHNPDKGLDVSLMSSDIDLEYSAEHTVIAVLMGGRQIPDIPRLEVAFAVYDGDPAGGGRKVGSGSGPVLQVQRIPWTGPGGARRVFVVVDPDNAIAETDETNNIASAVLTFPEPPPAPHAP